MICWQYQSLEHQSSQNIHAVKEVWVFFCKMFGHFTCLRSRNGHFSRRGNLSLSCWTHELVNVWKQNACYLYLKVVAQYFCSRVYLVTVLQMAPSVSTEFVLAKLSPLCFVWLGMVWIHIVRINPGKYCNFSHFFSLKNVNNIKYE